MAIYKLFQTANFITAVQYSLFYHTLQTSVDLISINIKMPLIKIPQSSNRYCLEEFLQSYLHMSSLFSPILKGQTYSVCREQTIMMSGLPLVPWWRGWLVPGLLFCLAFVMI